MSDQQAGDKVLHQDEHEEVIEDTLERASDEAAIADVAVAAGANPTKAEYDDLVGKFNKVLGVLQDAGLIPPNA